MLLDREKQLVGLEILTERKHNCGQVVRFNTS